MRMCVRSVVPSANPITRCLPTASTVSITVTARGVIGALRLTSRRTSGRLTSPARSRSEAGDEETPSNAAALLERLQDRVHAGKSPLEPLAERGLAREHAVALQ